MSQKKQIEKLESRLGYMFKNKELLVRALTHSSYGDGRRIVANYERLEFLGDRVLGLLTAEILFAKTGDSEGGLARRLNALVRKETCAEVALELGLGDLALISKSAEKQGGREKTSILGDLTESVLGAIYLDGGLEEAKDFYHKFWSQKIEDVLRKTGKDPKTALQEKAAFSKRGNPVYIVLSRSGPDHRPEFEVEVDVMGIGRGKGTGPTKKEAERSAAADLLANWSKK